MARRVRAGLAGTLLVAIGAIALEAVHRFGEPQPVPALPALAYAEKALSKARRHGVAGLPEPRPESDEQDRQAEAMLSDAMQAGKISPAEVSAWRANLTKPEARAGAAAMLSELPARYPVTMLGAGTTTTTELDTSAWDAQADRLGL